uniref:NAD(+)/NADH kinase n=1 Tax=Candidatus Cryptobacteroides bacterium TaxID=3085639 RepID=UPI004027BFAB
MKIALYSRDGGAMTDPRLSSMLDKLEKELFMIYETSGGEDLLPGTDLVMSVGGDGTFLSAARCVGASGVPILGVNLGRLGFLSEYSPEEACGALLSGAWYLEDRELLETEVDGSLSENPALSASAESFSPFTLNEVSVHRSGAALLGVDVTIDGHPLPTYWADGLLVATSSGSTAYSLSVGGPICAPEAKVLIIAPIAPHNLNARPLVVPDTTRVGISMRSRDESVMLSMDNRNHLIQPSATLAVKVAQFSLKRVRLKNTSFIKALTTKLFWGEDIRNSGE